MQNHQSSKPRPRKAEIQRRETLYVYHWDRILGVLAILILLIGAGGYGLVTWLIPGASQPQITEGSMPSERIPDATDRSDSESIPQSKPNEETFESPSSTPESSVIASNPSPAASVEANPEPPEIASATQGSADTDETASSQHPTVASQTSASSGEVIADLPLEERQAPTEPVSIPPELPSASQVVNDTTTNTTQPQKLIDETNGEKPVSEPTGGPFQLQEIKILSPQVKRFVLPRTVINKEPRGEMDEIRLKPDGSAAVWCYSEVVGMRDGTMRYVWYHEGKRMARIRVKVHGNRWRSYSSKILNQRYQGDWRVELQDNAGRLLASAGFTLK